MAVPRKNVPPAPDKHGLTGQQLRENPQRIFIIAVNLGLPLTFSPPGGLITYPIRRVSQHQVYLWQIGKDFPTVSVINGDIVLLIVRGR